MLGALNHLFKKKKMNRGEKKRECDRACGKVSTLAWLFEWKTGGIEMMVFLSLNNFSFNWLHLLVVNVL